MIVRKCKFWGKILELKCKIGGELVEQAEALVAKHIIIIIIIIICSILFWSKKSVRKFANSKIGAKKETEESQWKIGVWIISQNRGSNNSSRRVFASDQSLWLCIWAIL
jgi:hypothetical protein